MIKLLVRLLLLVACGAVAGCGFLPGKPPLPKHAAIVRAGAPAGGTDFRALVEQAEIIYFPEERAASGAKSEPAALLLEALQQSGKPYALAWGIVDASQQPLLDELQASTGAPRDELIVQLELTGTGRAREHFRSVLRDARLAGVRHIALRVPNAVVEKVASGAGLSAEERQYLAGGFTAPAGGFQSYAERFSGGGNFDERALAAAYRAEVVRRQFAAETIVRFFRSAPAETRLVVFAGSNDFGDGQGVPFYVAQKLKVRQLVLGREIPEPARGPLITLLRRGLQIVDRTPGSARH